MKLTLLLTFTAIALIGCAGGSIKDNSSDSKTVSFTCDRGDPVQVRYLSEQGSAILIRDGQSTELQQQPTGSGFSYTNGHTNIRGKGDNLTVLIGHMAPIQCIAQ